MDIGVEYEQLVPEQDIVTPDWKNLSPFHEAEDMPLSSVMVIDMLVDRPEYWVVGFRLTVTEGGESVGDGVVLFVVFVVFWAWEVEIRVSNNRTEIKNTRLPNLYIIYYFFPP